MFELTDLSAAFTYKNRLRVAFFIIQITYARPPSSCSLSLRCDLLRGLLLIVEVKDGITLLGRLGSTLLAQDL